MTDKLFLDTIRLWAAEASYWREQYKARGEDLKEAKRDADYWQAKHMKHLSRLETVASTVYISDLPHADEAGYAEYLTRQLGKNIGMIICETPRACQTTETYQPITNQTERRVEVTVLMNTEEAA